MRKKNFKGRCEKITVTKSKSICKTYDDLQRSYLEKLETNSDIQEIRMNIVLACQIICQTLFVLRMMVV